MGRRVAEGECDLRNLGWYPTLYLRVAARRAQKVAPGGLGEHILLSRGQRRHQASRGQELLKKCPNCPGLCFLLEVLASLLFLTLSSFVLGQFSKRTVKDAQILAAPGRSWARGKNGNLVRTPR